MVQASERFSANIMASVMVWTVCLLVFDSSALLRFLSFVDDVYSAFP